MRGHLEDNWLHDDIFVAQERHASDDLDVAHEVVHRYPEAASSPLNGRQHLRVDDQENHQKTRPPKTSMEAGDPQIDPQNVLVDHNDATAQKQDRPPH